VGGRAALGDRHDPAKRREDAGDLGCRLAERLAQRHRALGTQQRLLENLNKGQIRLDAFHVHTMARQDTHTSGFRLGVDLLDEAGLADPGLPGDKYQTPTSTQGRLHGPPQLGALVVTVDKWGQGRADGRSRRKVAGLTPAHLIQPPAFGKALEPEQASIVERVCLVGAQLPHQIRGQDLTAGGLGHDPGRRVHRLSVDRPVALGRLPVMEPDPHPHLTVGIGTVVLLQGPLDAAGAAQPVLGG